MTTSLALVTSATRSGMQSIPLHWTNSNFDSISPYLSTNDVPPDSEVVKIKERLRLWNEELSGLKDISKASPNGNTSLVIDHLAPNQNDHSTQQDLLLTSILAYSGCISSVRKVPPEIWEQIFILCLPETPFISARSPPLSLAAVSRICRDVAVNTRYLWSNIHIQISGDHIAHDQEEGNILEVWLSRARGLPLSLSVVAVGDIGAHSAAMNRAVSRVLAVLIKFSAYWESIHFEIPFNHSSSTLLDTLTAKDLPILRSALIIHSREILPGRAPWINFAIPSIPDWPIFKAEHLRRLHFVYSAVNPTLLDKWSQITDLKIESCYISPEDCFAILSRCKNLQTCFLDPCDRNTVTSIVNITAQFRSVELVDLTSLVIYEKTFLPILFDVPSLRTFEFQGFFAPNRPSLLPHLLRSARELESLRVDPGGVDLEELLMLTPSIKNLVLTKPYLKYPALHNMFARASYRGLINSVIQRLTPYDDPFSIPAVGVPNRDYLCPALESLVCEEDSLRRFTNDVLLTFMKKRKEESQDSTRRAAELKEVLIFSRPTPTILNPIDAFISGELLKLAKEGMKIHVPDYNLDYLAKW